MKEDRSERGIRVRYFLLSFSLAFLAFSLLFLGCLTLVKPKEAAIILAEPAEEAYEPQPEDAITVLFMGTADQDAAPGLFLLARFDPANHTVPLALLPPETLLRNNNAMETLAEIYRYGGASYTRDTVAANFGITVDRYVRIGLPAFLEAADAVGSVEFTLDRELSLDQNGTSVLLNPGRQLLDGKKAAAVFSAADSGREASLDRTGRLMAAIVNQRMDIALTVVVDSVFEKIINLIDTDISYPDYHNRKEAAAYLAGQGGEPAYPIALTGQWSGDGKALELSDTYFARITQDFG